jgi:ATP-dependent DNA ligase
MPRYDSRLRYVDHLRRRSRELFALACAHDTEGIVGKWAKGPYQVDGSTTSWLKVKNPAYTQAVGRHELFEGRGSSRTRSGPKGYRLDPAAASAAR